MASNLIRVASYEAENQIELSLRQAFELLEPKLRPPFALTIPDQQEYDQLNRAIVYGFLCEPHNAKTHIKHLHALVTDGYALFVHLLVKVVQELYTKLVDSVKKQLIWVAKEMIDVSGVGVDGLLVCLLRQIVGGDFSEGNLWLCSELVRIFLAKWDCLLEEEPLVLTSALYTYLRLLADHCMLVNNANLEALKQLEIDFCVKVLREQFHLCLRIGRDFIRVLQDLAHVPEFRAIWKDLVLNPSKFKTPGFSDISQFYRTRTSSRYSLLRITPEMETQLRFLLTHVKLGTQRRHLEWFTKKFLCGVERETLLSDIVRFICCAHHPTNEIIQSDVVPRWVAIGWLMGLCRKNHVGANMKLALFYDWLFFDERVDNIMNIEPAMLLMVYSIPRCIDMTHSLLEFLFLVLDNYDLQHNDIIVRGVSSAFSVLLRKGVIQSLDVLTSSDAISPFLRERLGRFLSGRKMGFIKDLQPENFPHNFLTPPSLPNSSCVETVAPSLKGQLTCTQEDGFATKPVDSSVPSIVTSERQVVSAENLVQNFGEKIKKSCVVGHQTLEEELYSFLNLNNQKTMSGTICNEVLSSTISKEFELNGYKIFSLLQYLPDNLDCDDEVGSATALLIRACIFSQPKMQDMLLSWSRNGFSVGARLLSYASRLAYEASMADCLGDTMVDKDSAKSSDLPLLIFHIDGYISFVQGEKESSFSALASTAKIDNKVVSQLVSSAFGAYRSFLGCSRTMLHKNDDASLTKLLISDLMSCAEWGRKRLKSLFCCVFHHLPDLSIGKEDMIKLLVSLLDHTSLVDVQFELGLKKLSVFGENTETILHLIESSLDWSCLEQRNFWGLIRSELAVSKVQLEKVILEFFCSDELDPKRVAIAVEGLLTLCCCRAPTPELVGAIMLLPSNVFQDFAAAVLATWAVSNATMLFDSLADFSEKFDSKTRDSNLPNSAGILVNHSAILWLFNNFDAKGMNGSDILRKLSPDIPGKK
ncbi:integrator complex subunit 3 homolog isoform X1 [Carya illinoinensis]|uniref:integrator complex subunit 3 homolog isoform X1 n=2 Tax=Carya illinoinensis TaxID=32201 RepID=UPI001C71884A|nr:integrator complex subunit 3 homolog isoform X1 [Carya illinoinensis]XP_042985167.1 integrator complex subunit 3 homolog isoform X1 [Carya illinoinensis]XP_042985168.1 integrator complex subunit 3 homolog isoform X1 [Carya illinoinensis]XP_042985169.1 integrator complex subunit 3 homolog isoform X1 [Carya illinoinensis]XP_042985170.1 integrator complex subunit 3 homolog isoform X1 [Carya illinoinensis]XP_042985171.1 integrator complex subunit 3 homolog isoform X1 [Carya illinoinensis]XP_04